VAQTLRRLATSQIARSDFAAAADTVTRLIGVDGLDEAAHRVLIDCLARAGRRAEALQQFEICARALRTELDIAPDAETIALADRIRAGSWPPPVVRARPRIDAPPANVVSASQKDATHPIAAAGVGAAGTADPEIGATGVAAVPVGVALVPARRSRRLRWSFAWIAMAVCVVAISLALTSQQPSRRSPSLLVSGFHNVSGISNEDSVIAGFGVLVSNSLVMQQHLRLIEDPADDARDTAQARDHIRQAAGVRYLLRGSVAFETVARMSRPA
jgi:hypothetical protein